MPLQNDSYTSSCSCFRNRRITGTGINANIEPSVGRLYLGCQHNRLHYTFVSQYGQSVRLAILSDIHGNLEALTRALEYIESSAIERVVCLGDIVGYGANPSECIDLLRSKTEFIVMGNHDEAAFDASRKEYFSSLASRAIDWTAKKLAVEEKEFLRGLPYSLVLNDLLFVHSAPRDPRQWDYIFSDFEARLYDKYFDQRLVFIGHSHVPGVFSMAPGDDEYNPEGRFIINVGSVGQPRDGNPKLSLGILDSVAGTYENIRLDYSVKLAAGKILEAGLPRKLAERLYVGY